MRVLLVALLAFLASIALGILIAKDAGRVVVMVGDWSMQTSTSVFAVALVLAVACAWLIARIVAGIFRLPRSFRLWTSRRRLHQSEALLARGLQAMLEGEWRLAERAFVKGAAHSRAPLIHYLYAARAAHKQGAAERRDRHLDRAGETGQDSLLAVGLTRAELELGEGRVEQAGASLRDLQARYPEARQVKRLLWEASRRLHDWGGALELLKELEPARTLPAEQLSSGKVEAYAGLIRDAGRGADRMRLDAVWHAIPRRMRREPRVLEAYVTERLRFPETADCEVLLRHHLDRSRDPGLMRLYGQVEGADPNRQLKNAEHWLQEQPRDPELLLTLGRLCRRGSLWGKARSYLEESIGLQPGPDALQELAALLEQQGEHAAAAACYQRGLALMSGGGTAPQAQGGATDRMRIRV